MNKIRDLDPGMGLAFAVLAGAVAIAAYPALASHLSGYGAPTGLSATTVDFHSDGNLDDVGLTWDAYSAFPSGCTSGRHIRIFRAMDGGTPAQIFAADAGATAYVDEDLAEGTYDYYLQARCNVPPPPGPGGADTNNLSQPSHVATALVSSAPPCAGPPTVDATATPTTLWPPNGKLVNVNVTGTVMPQQNCGMPESISYVVVDEYDELTVGPVEVAMDSGSFQFQIQLEASRRGSDLDGRLYAIELDTADGGNYGFDAVVPHDQRKK